MSGSATTPSNDSHPFPPYPHQPGWITVNGARRDIPGPTSVSELLTALGLRLGSVVVELNGTALTPGEAGRAVVVDGDRLELVRAVAGG
ncbi:MAG: sulfur carrier protein ThiS [Mycobacteriales bacterium]